MEDGRTWSHHLTVIVALTVSFIVGSVAVGLSHGDLRFTSRRKEVRKVIRINGSHDPELQSDAVSA